jgi:hypothetical protein
LKVPKRLKAFGREYSVKHDTVVTERHNCYGAFFNHEEAIILENRSDVFSEAKEASTFLHEVIHLLDDNLRCGLSEEQVGLLSVGLYSVISDNKLDFRPVKK